MADYSGDYDPIGYSLTSTWIRRNAMDWGPQIWGTYKDFTPYGPTTKAKILGFLIDGHNYGMAKAWERDRRIKVEAPRITWDQRYKTWTMIGGYRFDNEGGIEWLIRHGYLKRDDDGLHVLKDF